MNISKTQAEKDDIKETTRQFAEIYRKHTDPNEIRKTAIKRERQIIKEEKLSSFVIYE